jgi:hypothetical protein
VDQLRDLLGRVVELVLVEAARGHLDPGRVQRFTEGHHLFALTTPGA